MASRSAIMFCLQIFLLTEALGKPLARSPVASSISTPLHTHAAPTNLYGTITQVVAPGPTADWQGSSHTVPVITEIEPNLEIGEINAAGEMQISGTIKIGGVFPVFGAVGVDGKLATQGTAHVDLSSYQDYTS